MSQPKALRHWTDQIKRAFSNLSKQQARTLAAFSCGVETAQSRALNAAARALPFLGIPDTVEARLRGFIENLAGLVIRNLPKKDPVVLLVDETSLRDKLKAMVVAVAYECRAVPAAARLCEQTEWPMGQVELITETPMGSGRGGRQRPHRDGGQGHREFAEPAESDRKPGHVLHDARVERRSRDDGRQKDIPVQQFDGQAGEVLEKEGESVSEVGLDRALGGAPSMRPAMMSLGVWRRITLIWRVGSMGCACGKS